MVEEKSIRSSILKGASWVMAFRTLYRLLGLISTIVLARLLTPEDFGVVAIAMSIYALIELFSRLGFDTVIIQKQDVGREIYDTAWTLNFLCGVVLAIICLCASKFVGGFYESDDVESVMVAVSFLFIVNGVRNPGVIDFQKNIDFHLEFRLYIFPKIVSVIATISLAWFLQSFWALVIGNLFWKLVETWYSYRMHPFRPRWSLVSAKYLFGFSKWLMINNFIMYWGRKGPELFLGKITSLSAAASYTLANELGTMATSEVISNINRALYPGYARLSSDRESLLELYIDSAKTVAYLAIPMGVGLAFLSDPVVEVFLGEQWKAVAELLPYLALGGAINSLKSNNSYLFYVFNKPQLSTVEAILGVVFFAVLLIFLVLDKGLVGAAQAFFCSSIFNYVVSSLIVGQVFQVSPHKIFKVLIIPLVSSFIMFAAIWCGFSLIPAIPIIEIVFSALLGVIVYTLCIYLFWFANGRPNGVEKMALNFIRTKVFTST